MFLESTVFCRGIVLGLVVAAPVGPVGLLCIRRTLHKGLLIGFTTGLGAALADTIFGAIAAFSIASILDFIHHYDLVIRLLGGLFLFTVAWHTWRDHPRQPKQNTSVSGLIKGLASGFAITMTNPVTIFAVLAVVASFSGMKTNSEASALVAGIFAGSTLWWLTLAGGVALIKGHFTENRIMLINRITAIALTGLAVWAVGSSFQDVFSNIHITFIQNMIR